MAAIRNPRSAEAWGRASVDIALFGLAGLKAGQAGRLANNGRIGTEAANLGRVGRAAEGVLKASKGAGITDDWVNLSGMLKQAAKNKGNFGIGSGTMEQANAMGKAWVGDGYRTSNSGKAWISADGMKQYRPPSQKPFLNKIQANFERKFEGQTSRQWQSNAHLDIIEYLELD
ncbi:MAG: hypothetical protein S4CHLAM123_10430 [Chlamydiales bacterium]|nr:hypothetical protein [Chlamydiales bacterium]